MGSIIRPLLFAALLVLVPAPVLPGPVLAQQAEAPATGLSIPPAGTAPDANRQGPELNVYRDPVTPRAAPPAVAPTVAPPVAPMTTVQPVPQPAPRPAPASPASARTAPAEPRIQRPAPRTTAAPDAAGEAVSQSAPVAPVRTPPPAPVTNAGEAAAPVAAPAPVPVAVPAPVPADDQDIPRAWIIGAALALIPLAAFFLLRRRRPAKALAAPTPAAAPPSPAPAPSSPVPSPARPVPEQPAAAVPPASAPSTPDETDRPWIDMDMAVGQARYSMIGVTIQYGLILHNRGNRPAQDILIRGIVGNAGAQQAALLQRFFSGDDGLPLHSAVGIAPGETVQLTGELRLAPEDIVPVTMGQRSLLIPLTAFDMAYRWDRRDADPGQGRTARAFIVGQEQEPPADRLAPLRLDQGPRQYRRAAARAAAELTPA
ncbi:hypothetical protein Q4610_05625 [Sphingobium sp. HBC34]|uniref:Uncharacterized protein n=1 Tax=Sphingobium cyanobacteriorum TaxID=3063954 RepID=A0ABT8ZLX1_9SPHN|nr:hypothetical protein [Sphingobium sp. HBC34]MDO7834521.1 hypothetical protein [Sphingobium sp. HBC34]